MPFEQRQKALRSSHFFVCCCEACCVEQIKRKHGESQEPHAAKKLTTGDPRRRAALLDARAQESCDAGDYDAAARYSAKALQLLRHVFPPSSIQVISARRHTWHAHPCKVDIHAAVCSLLTKRRNWDGCCSMRAPAQKLSLPYAVQRSLSWSTERWMRFSS